MSTSRLNGEVHGFKLELPAEHATAHYPILDLENFFAVGSGAEDHGADETVVADSIQEAEFQSQNVKIVNDICYLLGGVAPGCRVELVGLVDQLDDAGVIDSRERPKQNRHFKSAEEFVDTLR